MASILHNCCEVCCHKQSTIELYNPANGLSLRLCTCCNVLYKSLKTKAEYKEPEPAAVVTTVTAVTAVTTVTAVAAVPPLALC